MTATEPKPVRPVEVPIPSRKPEIQEPAPDVLPEQVPTPIPQEFPIAPEVINGTENLDSPGD